jgi:hypothetical protein
MSGIGFQERITIILKGNKYSMKRERKHWNQTQNTCDIGIIRLGI